VWYSRLPTGHTHEDIDGVFAVIWNSMKDRQMLTLTDYKIHIENLFRAKKYEVKVFDIMALPDYKALIDQQVYGLLLIYNKK